MSESVSSNRRSEPRYYYRSGEPISWRADQASTRTRGGWLSNVSKNGAAFLMQGKNAPEVGDDVELTCDDGNQRLYNVVRTVAYGRDTVLVGCQHGMLKPAIFFDLPPSMQSIARNR